MPDAQERDELSPALNERTTGALRNVSMHLFLIRQVAQCTCESLWYWSGYAARSVIFLQPSKA
jgi:hypothetical protein